MPSSPRSRPNGAWRTMTPRRTGRRRSAISARPGTSRAMPPGPGHAARAGILLRLAHAYLGAGDAPSSEDAHNQALDAAEASGDVALIAEAALAYGEVGLWQTRPYGTVDERVIAAIAFALELPVSHALRARLLIAQAIARYYD